MALNYTPRCIRCRKKMRNDGTIEYPKWVCDEPTCVRYVPEPKEEPPQEETVTDTDVGGKEK